MFKILKLDKDNIYKYIDDITQYEKDNFYDEAYTYKQIEEFINEYDNIEVLLFNDKLIGYIIYRDLDIIHLFKIYINDCFKGKGYAKLLLDSMISHCINNNKIYAEVRSNNLSAIKFYNKNGFKILGNKKDFYKNPKDNAIILEKVVKND